MIYSWKDLGEHFPVKMKQFAYLDFTSCRRAWIEPLHLYHTIYSEMVSRPFLQIENRDHFGRDTIRLLQPPQTISFTLWPWWGGNLQLIKTPNLWWFFHLMFAHVVWHVNFFLKRFFFLLTNTRKSQNVTGNDNTFLPKGPTPLFNFQLVYHLLPMCFRPHSVYFTVNRSRQAYLCLVGGKKIKNKISLLAHVVKNGSILTNLNVGGGINKEKLRLLFF